jgi:hypothetical protein
MKGMEIHLGVSVTRLSERVPGSFAHVAAMMTDTLEGTKTHVSTRALLTTLMVSV